MMSKIMSNNIKLGLTALMLVGSASALAAEDLKSTGLAPEPMTTDVAPSSPAGTDMGVGAQAPAGSATDMGTSKAVDTASMAVKKAQEATEAARVANDAAKVANDVAKMATDKAVEATDDAKKAMEASGGAVGASTGMSSDSGAAMTGDTMKNGDSGKNTKKKKQ